MASCFCEAAAQDTEPTLKCCQSCHNCVPRQPYRKALRRANAFSPQLLQEVALHSRDCGTLYCAYLARLTDGAAPTQALEVGLHSPSAKTSSLMMICSALPVHPPYAPVLPDTVRRGPRQRARFMSFPGLSCTSSWASCPATRPSGWHRCTLLCAVLLGHCPPCSQH